MVDIQFDTVEVPVQTRSAAPNPFAETIADLITEDGKGSGKALAFTVKGQDLKSKPIQTVARQLRDAGRKERNGKADVTVRQKIEQVGKDVRVTFWVVEKIRHADAASE